MTDNEILTIDEIIEHCNRTCENTEILAIARGQKQEDITSKGYWEHYQVANYLEELKQYRAMEQRLKNIYGECDGLLEVVISSLERHENFELPSITVKSRLLTDEDVDMWNGYRAIGTIEEFKALKDKSEPKKPKEHPANSRLHYCPCCGSYHGAIECYNYCPECGQKLDWH